MASGLLNIGKERGRQLKETDKTPKSGLIAMGRQKNQGGIPGAIGYIAGRAGTDFLRVGEGVVDAALVPVDLLTGNVEKAKSRFLNSPVDAMRERLDREYNPGKVAGFIGDIAGGIGQSVGYGLISAIPYAGQPMMYSSIIEQSISSAAEKTGEVGLKEVGYGATVGGLEGLLESKLGAGVNAFKGIGSAILKKTGLNVAESAAKAGGKTMLKSVLTETAKGAAGEFAEEAISEAVDPALLRLYNIDENAQFSLKDVAYAGLIGGLSGGMMSAGPAAINYRSSVSVGRALQESGMDGDLVKRAKYTLSALEAAQTRSTSQIKGKPEGDTKETAKEWLSRTAENRKVKRLSRETKELADKVRKNIDAYEKYRADPKMSNSEPVAALLGELRGNLFLVGYAYEADVIEQVMMDATDEQRQAFVDAVNEVLAAQGKKHDYTLAEFDANKDDIRRGLAGLLMADEMQGYTVKYGAEATESPVEPAQAPKDTTAEEVAAQEENAATEDLSGIEEEVWKAVTDETVKGYGTQNEQEEALLRAAVSQNVPEKSIPLMLERFREGTDMTPAEFADAWADGVLLFGRLGLNEKKISQESALSRMSEKARHASIEYGKYLSEEQRAKEQEAAKKKKRPVKEGASKKPKGEVVRHPGINLKEDLDDAQFTAYKAAEIMAPALKADIEIHKGLTRDGKEVNGYYDLKTNTIHVNINAVRDGKHIALYTLGHEVTHYIKEWSPKKFYELGDYVMKQLGEGAEQAIRDKLDFLKRNDLVKGLDETEAYDRAYEEVVADGMELVLTDGTVLDALARENKPLWQKIKDRIFEIIEKIKKAYNDLSKTSRTAQILSETMDSLDDIEQLFYEGVREAGERTRTAGIETVTRMNEKNMHDSPDVIFSRDGYSADEIENRIADNKAKVLKMPPVSKVEGTEFAKGEVDLVTQVTKYFESKNNACENEELGTVKLTRTGAKSDIAHGIGRKKAASFNAVPDVISEGKIVDYQRNWKNRGYDTAVVVAPITIAGDEYLMGCVVIRAKEDNIFYLHEVAQIKKDGTPSFKTGSSNKSNPSEDVPSVMSILQNLVSVKSFTENSAENSSDIRYSIDDTPETPDVSENRDLTDRELLGMALEGAVQNQAEFDIVKSYREQTSMLELAREKRNAYSKEAAKQERQIKALRARMDEEGDPSGFIRKAMDEAIAKKREAEKMRDEQTRILDNADRELLRLKATKPFRDLVAREQKRVRAAERKAERAEEVAERKVERARESADKRVEKEKEKLERLAGESKERGEITARKRTVMRVLGSLETKLYHPTKANHVPKELHDLAMKTLAAADPKAFNKNRANIKEMGELAAKIERLERKADRTAKEQNSMDGWKERYEELESETIPLKKQAESMLTAFIEYNEKAPDDLKYPKAFINIMTARVSEIEDVPLSQMGLRSLEAVETFVTMLSQQVKSTNELFAQKRGEQVSEWGNQASREASESKAPKLLSPRSGELAGIQGIRDFLWKNMKPLTAFDVIGSSKLMTLLQAVLDGEDVWITDVLEAKKALDEAKKTYNYNKWDHKKRHELTTQEGKTVRLTVGELMSLYAYAQREQAKGHLTGGGFKLDPRATEIGKKGILQFEKALNQAETYKLTELDFGAVASMLTEEQKAYADTVQQYLTSLGEKGNEVSRALYGMDAFTEEHYFPIKVISEVLASQTGKTGDPKIKNRGAFQETTPDAKETILLQDFMEIAAGHVNDIATYHAFVLPVEDLTRVLNYKPSNVKIDENGNWVEDKERTDFRTLKEVITAKYGTQAVSYIEQLLRDLNGGARRESAASILDKGLTAFKRSATMLSLSTIVQQPTSIIRAMAYVDGRHFKGASFVPWETVKKYAPVAAIKEIGGHDTSTGVRTADYINSKEYENQKDKLKAAALGILPESYGGDKQARDEYFGWLTSKADEVSWRYMFGAIVNEQAEKLNKPKDSEEVLKAAGKRFAEVVRRTQVYDSTLTRSEYMRSKDGLMKMATAFGAEPTTVVSMVVDAIIKAERGDKTFRRKSAAGIAFSIIANAAVASLIYAMRDDDEDETIPEKYVQSLTSELIEGFNPLEYLPIARDIMSMFKGYEIERSDMALIGNLMEQVELITSSKRSVPDKIFGVTGAVSAFFGLPVTNVYRDLKGLWKTGQSFTDAEEQTGAGLGHAMGDAVRGQFNLFSKLFGAESGNAYELYTAYVRGDTAHYERVKARYKTPQAAEMALRTELRDNDKRISEAAEARLSGDLAVYESIVDQIESEGIFDRGIVIRAINNEMLDLKDEDTSKLVPKDETVPDEEDETAESLYKASDLNNALERGDAEDFAAILAALVEDKVRAGKTEAQAKASVKSSITAHWKKLYIEAWSRGDTEERKRIIAILTETGLYGSRNDVATLAQNWVKNSK